MKSLLPFTIVTCIILLITCSTIKKLLSLTCDSLEDDKAIDIKTIDLKDRSSETIINGVPFFSNKELWIQEGLVHYFIEFFFANTHKFRQNMLNFKVYEKTA